MTEQYEWNHGSIPAERRAFLWTTTLLQVRDGAKWRKMTSSQAAGPCPQAVVWQFDLQHGSPCPTTYSKASALSKPIQEHRGKRRCYQAVGLTPIVNT